MKFKKIVILGIALSLILSGCSGSDTKTPEQIKADAAKAGYTVYDSDNFSIQIFKDWETIDKSSFTSNVPNETIAGFRNNIKNDIFTANINITEKQLDTKQTPSVTDFAKSNQALLKSSLINFKLISEKEGKMPYGKDSLATYDMEFEGQKTSSEPVTHFHQLYVINKSMAYTVTGAYLPNEDESVVNDIGVMLNSLALK